LTQPDTARSAIRITTGSVAKRINPPPVQPWKALFVPDGSHEVEHPC
jgi:hypothetical protein